MKTHEELVEEFRLEFEKKRRKEIHALWREILYFLFIATLLFILSLTLIGISLVNVDMFLATKINLFLIKCGITIVNAPNTATRIASFVLGVVLMWLGGYIFFSSIKELMDEFNVDRLLDAEKKSLDNLTDSKTQAEKDVFEIEETLTSRKEIINLIQNPEITVITPESTWPNCIIGMAKMDEKKIEKIQENILSFDESIAESNAKLEVYNQISEKNFWQYLKSRKWMKTSKTK